MTEIEREEEHLQELLNEGEIDVNEYNHRYRDLQRDYRAQAEQSAQDA